MSVPTIFRHVVQNTKSKLPGYLPAASWTKCSRPKSVSRSQYGHTDMSFGIDASPLSIGRQSINQQSERFGVILGLGGMGKGNMAMGEKFDQIIPDDAAASRFVDELYAFCKERGVDANIGYLSDGAEVYVFCIHTKRIQREGL